MKHLSSFFVLLYLSSCSCLIHELTIEGDKREKFFIENFGYLEGGQLHLTVTDFKVDGHPLESQSVSNETQSSPSQLWCVLSDHYINFPFSYYMVLLFVVVILIVVY